MDGGGSGSAAGLSPQFFPKGAEVEVRSDDDGFKDAWYLATVLEPPVGSSSKRKTKNQNKICYYVQYQSLRDDDDETQPLRENVHAGNIRPSPPPEPHSFELGDVVDAYCRDGWWTGVITEVRENSRFVVCFQNPPDVMELGESDLRVHRKWINGQWIEPEKQSQKKTSEEMFSAGQSVEVSFDREDCLGVWFPGILRHEFDDGSFLVECQFLVYGDDGVQTNAKVSVDSLHIRPSPPPQLEDKQYVLFDKVDGFYDFGWWSGVITKELADNRYTVFFKHAKKDKELSLSDLRLHMEWKEGKWFSASQQVGEQTASHGKGRARPAKIQVKRTQTVASAANGVGIAAEDCLEKECIAKDLEHPVITECDMQMETRSEKFDQFAIKESLRDLKQQLDSPASNKIKQVGEQTASHGKGRARPAKIQVKRPPILALAANGVGIAAEDFLEKECTAKDLEHPVVTECDMLMELRSEKFDHFSIKESLGDPMQQLDSPASNKIKDLSQIEIDEESIRKRKRGRPRKFTFINPNASVTDESVVKDCIMIEVDLPSVATLESTMNTSPAEIKPIHSPLKQENRYGNTKKVKQHEKLPYKKIRKIKSSSMEALNEGDSEDPVGGEKGEGGHMANEEGSIDDMPNNSDDQPLSTWIGGIHSPAIANGSSKTINQCSDTSDSQKVVIQSSVDCGGEIIPCENQTLPFVKNTILWRTIEGMEVFQKIPQNPHFRPLSGCRESSREGLAIGLMVNFSSLVDRISTMRLDEPHNTIEDGLETLAELETNGFDVQVVRDRLVELLLMKNKNVLLEEELEDVNKRIVASDVEKSEISEEIEGIEKEMRALEEKRTQVMLKKKAKEEEIACLKTRLEEIDEVIKPVQSRFADLATSIW